MVQLTQARRPLIHIIHRLLIIVVILKTKYL